MKGEKYLQSALEAHGAGDIQGAEAFYRRFLRDNPAHHGANNNLGLLLLSSGRAGAAIPLFQKVVKLYPGDRYALVNLGNAHAQQRQHAEALDCYRRAVAVAPELDLAWYNYGKCLAEMRRHQEAVAAYEKALALNAGNPKAWTNCGISLHELGRHGEALACHDKAIALAPQLPDPWINRSASLLGLRRADEALASARHVLELRPDMTTAWMAAGDALAALDRVDEAKQAYEKAIAFEPGNAQAWYNVGLLHGQMGEMDKARDCYDAAIAARPDFGAAHYNLSALLTYTKATPHLACLESMFENRQRFADEDRIGYDFALGKALEDIGEYDRAFAAYEDGNRLKYALLPYDEEGAERALAHFLGTFTEEFLTNVAAAWKGHEDRRTPIFIVGMPRSGTTLLEQILGSHPSVHSAGELSDLSEVIDATFTGGDAAGGALSEAQVRTVGERYIERVWKLSPNSTYITDKMPGNFFQIGLIHLALPQAKIIHAMRDPMDSCFSCFSRLFNNPGMAFTYDQGALGRYYVRYMTLMRHWHRVLPPGTILDLPYEDMVADTETQARRVLEFVGLPWDPNCLKFHETKRTVKTASLAQVRKPIYKTSVARWKRFEKHLRPLLEIVKDYRPADDRNENS